MFSKGEVAMGARFTVSWVFLASLCFATEAGAQIAGESLRDPNARYDILFALSIVASVIGGIIYHRMDEAGEQNKAERWGLLPVAGMIVLYALYGDVWTWRGLQQMVGLRTAEAYAARPFFDEAKAQKRKDAREGIFKLESEIALLRNEYSNKQGKSGLLVARLQELDGRLTTWKDKRAAVFQSNPGLEICWNATAASLEAVTSEGKPPLPATDMILNGAMATACASLFARSEDVRGYVSRAISMLRDIELGERMDRVQIPSLQGELNRLRGEENQLMGRISELERAKRDLSASI